MSGVVVSEVESCGALVVFHHTPCKHLIAIFLHNARLALWGNVSCAAFREKLRTCDGSCCTAEDQISAALLSVARRSWPWCSSPLACCSLLCASFSIIVTFVLLVRTFLLALGSFYQVSLATVIGLNFGWSALPHDWFPVWLCGKQWGQLHSSNINFDISLVLMFGVVFMCWKPAGFITPLQLTSREMSSVS